MKNFQTRLTTAFATGAVLLNAIAPVAFAQTSLTITGNGSSSNNDVNVSQNNSVNVTQNNTANIDNNVDVNSSTGNNTASGNVGGDVEVTTGNATTNVSVSNVANSNSASVDACCTSNATVNISGNGSDSYNDVDLKFDNNVNVDQDNDAHIDNNVDVDSDTGDNKASDNVGGNVTVKTGNTDTTVTLTTAANANSAVVSGGEGHDGGTVSAWILGNGTGSDNDINIDLNNDVNVDQYNDAYVDNNVDVYAETGDNKASDNVGGDVAIHTGNADATIEADTLVNFNAADVEGCACLTGLEAKIAGNGSFSDSVIEYDADTELDVDQDNHADVDNDADVDGDTGDNKSNDNVGAVDAESDPMVHTGNTETTVDMSTSGNANTFGEDLGDLLDGLEIDFDFDFSGLLSMVSDWM